MNESPPPYGMPQKKSGNPLIWVFVAIVAFCCIAVIAGGGLIFATAKQGGAMLPCMMTTHAAIEGITDYAAEHGVYPTADKWQEQIAPYYVLAQEKLEKEMENEGEKMPFGIGGWFKLSNIDAPLPCSQEGIKTWLSFNTQLSGKKVEEVKEPAETVVLYEATLEQMNANAPYKKLDKKDSPRMMGQPRGWWIGYADGEVGSSDPGSKSKIDFEI